MTLAYRHRPIPSSPLARWDARWKLAAVILSGCGIAALDHLVPAAVALALVLFVLLAARLPVRWLYSRLSLFAMASLPFLLVLPFTLVGDGWDVGSIHISVRGLIAGAAVSCRGLAIGGLALVLVGTAQVHHTLAAAHKLKLPGLLVQLTLLAYRYAFLLGEEFRRLRIAMRTRGFRVRATRHGYRSLGHATGALLVRGSDRAEHVAAAMRCRGFDGKFHTLTTFHTTVGDVLAFLAFLTATIVIVVWDLD